MQILTTLNSKFDDMGDIMESYSSQKDEDEVLAIRETVAYLTE